MDLKNSACGGKLKFCGEPPRAIPPFYIMFLYEESKTAVSHIDYVSNCSLTAGCTIKNAEIYAGRRGRRPLHFLYKIL
ncbi:MAG: hypothetical protein IJF09_05505, partial [Ruminiclostridium sp.]|nr:hypothetical protein [Ruminiclostridium sp.]